MKESHLLVVLLCGHNYSCCAYLIRVTLRDYTVS